MIRDWVGRERRRFAAGWDGFWFAPEPTWTAALVRIAWGAVVAAWGLAALADAPVFFGPDGVRPQHPDTGIRWGLMQIFESQTAATVIVCGIIVGGLVTMVGFRSRVAVVLTWLCLLSIARRNPEITNSGDVLLRNIGFFLMFAPTGSALSLDRWLRDRDNFWTAPARAPWALRLIQIQISVLYLYSTWAKLRGDPWIDGTAVGDTWRAGQFVRFEVPMVFYDSILVSNLATFGTLAIEAALIALIWDRRLRPYVIALGVLLHIGIELSMAVGFFSLAVFVGYVAFTPGDAAGRFVLALRERYSGATPRSPLRKLQRSGKA